MIALYTRVSTGDQKLDAQQDALRAWAATQVGDVVEYSDVMSGKRSDRPGFKAMMEQARLGAVKVVAVAKLDRLSRSLRDLVNTAYELEEHGCTLVVLDQGIRTDTPSGRMLLGILGTLAAWERETIVERTKAGVAAARRRGRHPGRPKALDRDQVARARRLRQHGRSFSAIAAQLGCGKATVVRALRRVAS
jgi:DNA invertase Pin-like site-specific DNA recombinase